MTDNATSHRVRFCAGPNGCVFDDLYTGAPLDHCRYCGRTRGEAHPYPPSATSDRTADLIAACCVLQELADSDGCPDRVLVALHVAIDEMSAAAGRVRA